LSPRLIVFAAPSAADHFPIPHPCTRMRYREVIGGGVPRGPLDGQDGQPTVTPDSTETRTGTENDPNPQRNSAGLRDPFP
jgi:hypothetical protein